MPLHEKSELAKVVFCHVITDSGVVDCEGLGLSSYSYHPFSEKYVGELDILISSDKNVIVTGRNRFTVNPSVAQIPVYLEIVQKVPHISKKLGQIWWSWPEEKPT